MGLKETHKKIFTASFKFPTLFQVSNTPGFMAAHNTKNCPNTRQQVRPYIGEHKDLNRNHHQLLDEPSLLCTLQSHHKTSGTQGIAGMLPSVSQASAARGETKRVQCKQRDKHTEKGGKCWFQSKMDRCTSTVTIEMVRDYWSTLTKSISARTELPTMSLWTLTSQGI